MINNERQVEKKMFVRKKNVLNNAENESMNVPIFEKV